MKIQLIGFDHGINSNQKRRIFEKVVNESYADLVLFPGHTLRNENDIDYLCSTIENHTTTVIFELKEADPTSCMHTNNELYIYQNGIFKDMYSSQIYATGDDIDKNENLMEKLFDEIPRRSFVCCSKRITILQCGETAMLESLKKDHYKSQFRFRDNSLLNKRFEHMLKSTDIFLNPIHTIQGEQGIMMQRRIALSNDNRYYASTSSLDETMGGKFNCKRLQYVFYNGVELNIEPEINAKMGYVVRAITIE